MKIIACVRTRNEERNIGQFCESYYQWVDEILVADGGSNDATIEIASRFPKTTVLHFNVTVRAENGLDGNPQPEHFLFLREEAIERGADWIIFDDCDCFPNYWLKADALHWMRITKRASLFVRRVYFYGPDKIFPKMHEPGASLWAWRPSQVEIDVNIEKPWRLELTLPNENNRLPLMVPYWLLHHPWPTPELTQTKIDYYRQSGRHPTMLHPTQFAGKLADPEPDMRPDP